MPAIISNVSPALNGASETRRRKTLNSERHVPYFFDYISNKLSNSARKRFNLGVSEWRIMSVLASTPKLSAHQLSSMLGIDKGAINRSLQKWKR
ncbi:MAG: DNA-binding MarR family transcriptional regulator [Afipia broomeae]|jgi:DNA-binding MarR family transcriptional regulator